MYNIEPTMSSTITIAATAPSGTTPLRSRRKAAKAAAAIVATALKEEESVPDDVEYTPPASNKRSYVRANSLSSTASASSHGSAHHSGGGHVSKNTNGHPKKKTALSSYAVEYLKAWMMSPTHIEHPYPTEDEKSRIMSDTCIELKQLTNWFVNNRKRYWKPKVEEMRRKMTTSNCNRSLQELAAIEQARHGGSIPAAAAAALASANNGGGDKRASHTSVVSASSEGEESYSSREERKSYNNNSKRRKYSTKAVEVLAAPPPVPPAVTTTSHATNTRRAKKAKASTAAVSTPAVVANPMARLPPIGIATAATYENVKAARKKSRIVSDTSSNGESEESDAESGGESVKKIQAAVESSTAGVFNPLAAPVLTSVPSSGIAAKSPQAIARTVTAAPVPATVLQVPTVPLTDEDLMADLDFSITPLDNKMAMENTALTAIEAVAARSANAEPATAAVAAASAICCGGVMPHSCNLADPMSAKSRYADPCALCSACRDWNLGEFCPWDLTGIIGDLAIDKEILDLPSSSDDDDDDLITGIIGDISTDMEITDLPSSSNDEDDYFTAPMTTLQSSASAGSSEDVATTITKSSSVDFERALKTSGSIPQEIGNSSSAADFMSSMADIEFPGLGTYL